MWFNKKKKNPLVRPEPVLKYPARAIHLTGRKDVLYLYEDRLETLTGLVVRYSDIQWYRVFTPLFVPNLVLCSKGIEWHWGVEATAEDLGTFLHEHIGGSVGVTTH